MTFDWYESPTEESAHRATGLLAALGAIQGQDGSLTELGRQMSAFPLHPRFSRMLITAAEFNCLEDAALCAALAQGRDLLMKPTELTKRKQEDFFQRDDLSEFQALMRAFDKAASTKFDPTACAPYGIHARAAHDAMRTYEQIGGLCRRMGLANRAQMNNEDVPPPRAEDLARAILSAFSDHLGVETASGSRVYALAAGYKGHLEKDATSSHRPCWWQRRSPRSRAKHSK
ncbi:hypothetical protein [Verrucomicrobium spinosum]|uniref:hypothetical protein n=1 Tax=Verrucomicrobium spinosum TaxID=2736 RepID=UPI000946675C|nr:hypothetical protein [Verrucomicrobium spinosum]